MHVALLGGTGDIGEGLALRLARDTDHAVTVGSRDAEKAGDAAGEYETTLADHGVEATVESAENAAAAAAADVAVCCVPRRPIYSPLCLEPRSITSLVI
ncbi:NAD(P)-binding domain-containing protein [Halovenus salina]|uniref:NAD(P)-binding domain-containing protein n=1 Tax=Halovenus salina TaxID=1510225 RepID=A0ABD5W1Z0_9EURY|nr:NAD(P)-binding domain-containing protein [Halovenus salina]